MSSLYIPRLSNLHSLMGGTMAGSQEDWKASTYFLVVVSVVAFFLLAVFFLGAAFVLVVVFFLGAAFVLVVVFFLDAAFFLGA